MIDAYIEFNKGRWAASTMKSERARLNAIGGLLDGDPHTLWNGLQELAPYARKTTFIRAGEYWMWAHKSSIYKDWMRNNSKLFANAYQKERLTVSYEDALLAIERLEPSAKRRALELLMGAQRYCEGTQPRSDTVVGKGGKVRPDFRPQIDGPDYTGTYIQFWRALKKVGLKPHTLRKLALTRMAENGASMFDLMEVAGWSSLQPAASYIQPSNTSKLKKLLA